MKGLAPYVAAGFAARYDLVGFFAGRLARVTIRETDQALPRVEPPEPVPQPGALPEGCGGQLNGGGFRRRFSHAMSHLERGKRESRGTIQLKQSDR